MEVANWNPKDVGVVGSLIVLITIVVHGVLTRRWVPGIYFHEAQAELAREREKREKALDLVEQVSATHATLVEEHRKLGEEYRRVVQSLSPRIAS